MTWLRMNSYVSVSYMAAAIFLYVCFVSPRSFQCDTHTQTHAGHIGVLRKEMKTRFTHLLCASVRMRWYDEACVLLCRIYSIFYCLASLRICSTDKNRARMKKSDRRKNRKQKHALTEFDKWQTQITLFRSSLSFFIFDFCENVFFVQFTSVSNFSLNFYQINRTIQLDDIRDELYKTQIAKQAIISNYHSNHMKNINIELYAIVFCVQKIQFGFWT